MFRLVSAFYIFYCLAFYILYCPVAMVTTHNTYLKLENVLQVPDLNHMAVFA